MIGFIWICALGLHADPIPIKWTHLIGMASLNTEKLEQVLYPNATSRRTRIIPVEPPLPPGYLIAEP